MADCTPIKRSAPARLSLCAVAVLLATSVAAPPAAQASERIDVCESPSDRGYDDGRLGAKKAQTALSRCPKQAATYDSAYRAGAYVRSLDRTFGGGDGAAAHRPSAGSNGASSGAFDRAEPLNAGTQRTLRRSRCGYAAGRAAGAAGAPEPYDCGASPATKRGFQQGRTLRRVQAEAARSAMEKSRLNTRLLRPSLSAGERRLIENRLRTINRQEGLRRIRDPKLR